MAVDPRFERSVRRWLRAYPRRWRLARSAEVLGTLVDLAGPGATRLDRRAGLGLLVGGLATRARTGPPWYRRIGYVFGAARMPAEHLGWVADDLAAPVPTTRLLWWLAYLGLASGPLVARRHDAPHLAWLAVCLLWAILVDAPNPGWRRRQGLRLLLPAPGDLGGASRWVSGHVPRIRLSARSVSASGACCLAAIATAALVGWLAAPRRGPVGSGAAVCASALLVGTAAASVAMRRWRRWAGRGPAQPDRTVRPGRARAALVVVGLGTLAPALVVIETAGRSLAGVSAVLVVVGLALLPGAVAAWRWSAGAPGDVAAVDLLRVAVTGRAPTPDRPVPAAVPAGTAGAGTSLADLVHIGPDRPLLGGA